LKIKTISKLGDLKIKEATPYLLEMLKSKSLEHSVLKDKIDEKICLALGSIGSQEAIPVLCEIVGQKGLLQRKAHSESVRAAAKKALEMLEPENPQTI
jgi:HEAT repeat protein